MPRISDEKLAQLRRQALECSALPRQSGPESIVSFDQVKDLLEDLHEARLHLQAYVQAYKETRLIALELCAQLEVRTSRPAVHAEIPPQHRGRKKHSAWLHGYWEGWRGQNLHLHEVKGGEAVEWAAQNGYDTGAAAANEAIALKIEELKAKKLAKEGKPCAG